MAAAGRAEVRLTPALVVLVVLLGVLAGLRPAVASPTVTAVVWAGLVATVAVGVIWPLVDHRARRVAVDRCPTDIVEGTEFPVGLSVGRAGFPLRVDLDPSIGSLGPGEDPSGGVFVNHRPVAANAMVSRRGVYDSLVLRVTDTGPFGLLGVTRTAACVLAAPLYVGPREASSHVDVERDGSGTEQSKTAQVVMAGDTVRSVRPYVAGDPAHLVHWRTSAHVGELMVMELEPPSERLVVVLVDLRGAGHGHLEGVEQAVRRAAGTVRRCLDENVRVVLCTAQAEGPLTAEVHSLLQLRRRMAAAVPGAPGPVPDGATPLVFTP